MNLENLEVYCPKDSCKVEEDGLRNHRRMTLARKVPGVLNFQCPNCHNERVFKERFWGTGYEEVK